MATQLSRTFGSQGNQRKFTISTWVKRNKLGTTQSFFGSGGATNYSTAMYFRGSDDTIVFYNYFNGAYAGQKYSSASYRDTSAWYHIVFRVDTTSATASERMRIYVNGEEISYATSNNPNQNQTMEVGHTGTHYIGGYGTGAQAEMCMSHYHYCDGQSYAPTEFGEYDANGVWKIKLEPSVSYGNNGFFVLKDGNSGTDQSGNSNNFTVTGGTLTNTEDNPSNVFCTLNPLDASSSGTFSNGNNTYGVGSATWCPAKSTLAFTNGKYYCEAKGVSGTNLYVGVYDVDVARGSVQSEMDSNRIVYVSNGSIQRTLTGNSEVTGLATYTTSDIIGCAVDKENGTVKFYKNGTLIYTETDSSVTNKTLCFGTQVNNSTLTYNFGNGYFGTTAVASAGTNASGIGIFEYDVPTGYTALSTKGLNL